MAGIPPAPSIAPQLNNNKEVWPPISNQDYANQVGYSRFHVDVLKNLTKDFARANLYVIEFELDPKIIEGFCKFDNRKITSMTAKTVSIPAFNIGKLEIKRMGQRLYIPTTQELGEIQITIMCDSSMTQRKFLHSWLKHLVYDTDFNYYKKLQTTYSSIIKIKQLDSNYNTIMGYRYNKAFPTSIGEIQYGFDSDSQITEFPATFCFSTCELLTNVVDDYKVKS